MPRLKPTMQSLLSRGKAFLTPNASSSNLTGKDGFTKVVADTALFPKPSPDVDGDDCLQDCSTCTIHYPAKFSIDEDDKLYGHVNGWDTHLIVGTGKTDWVRDIHDEKGSVMAAVGKYGQEYQRSEGKGKAKLMLSASNMPTGGEHGDCDMEEGSDCMLLPSWRFIEKVRPEEVEDLMREVVERSVINKSVVEQKKRRRSEGDVEARPVSETTTTEDSIQTPTQTSDTNTNTTSPPLDQPPTQNGTESNQPELTPLTLHPSLTKTPSNPNPKPKFLTRTRPIPHSALILMCSHKTRDARCGQSAPLLRKELERHLRPLGLYRDLHDERPGGVGIYFINHVGGHKYSANVMVYRRTGSLFPDAQEVLGDDGKGVQNGGTEANVKGKGERKGEGQLCDEAVQGIWLARVRPEDCEAIVKYTVLQGKVVKPESQLRGGFDRSKGLASW